MGGLYRGVPGVSMGGGVSMGVSMGRVYMRESLGVPMGWGGLNWGGVSMGGSL